MHNDRWIGSLLIVKGAKLRGKGLLDQASFVRYNISTRVIQREKRVRTHPLTKLVHNDKDVQTRDICTEIFTFSGDLHESNSIQLSLR
jgi:hypothetical protein